MRERLTIEQKELKDLCILVKKFLKNEEYDKVREMICAAMGRYPDAPQPHNLFGVLMEETGDHVLAMKHFRAAWDLDPTYQPARVNLSRCGSTIAENAIAYDENDCV